MNYLLHLAIYFGIFAITALGLDIVLGYCGLITMAHAGYFALGCYSYALLSLKLHWGFLPAAMASIGVGILLSVAVSLPAWRFRDDFFVLISLSAQVLFFGLMTNWFDPNGELGTLRNLTNGPFGISSIPRPVILGYRFDSYAGLASLSLGMALASAVLLRILLQSPWGRLLKAIRDDDLAARGLGKNVRVAQLQAFALACGMAAMAGALYASYVGYIDPSNASLDQSVLFLSMVIVGGAGNLVGPLVGAFVLLAIPEGLRYLHLFDAAAANLRLMIFGLLMVLLMHFRPQGLVGEYRIE
jgi:branched-chain amino acid transport system permease protein